MVAAVLDQINDGDSWMLLTPSQQSFSGSEQGLEFYPLCVDLIGTSIFVVVGTFHGRQVRVLIDTGAGLSFISEDLCRDLELTMTPCLDKMIKLGNAGTCSVDKMIKANITLSDLTLDFEPYQLTLPKGIDIIIGRATSQAAFSLPQGVLARTATDQNGQVYLVYQILSVPRYRSWKWTSSGRPVENQGDFENGATQERFGA